MIGRGVFRRPYEQCRHHDGFDSRLCLGAAVSRLYLSARAKPAAVLSRVAMGLGRLLAALRSRRFPSSAVAFFVSELFLVAMALCIFVSTRLMRDSYHFRWYDAAVGSIRGRARTAHSARTHRQRRVPAGRAARDSLGLGLAVILLYCSAVFYLNSHRREIAGLPGARGFAGVVGSADGRGAIAESDGRDVRQRQPLVWAGAADAAGHRHGDGAV